MCIKRLAMTALAAVAAGATLRAAVPAFDTLIAHRGESVDAPENTLPAFKTAVERGFGFECHVWTCNSIDQVETALVRGIQTVSTDVPQKMLDEYKAKKR